jgi:hypothetical protein
MMRYKDQLWTLKVRPKDVKVHVPLWISTTIPIQALSYPPHKLLSVSLRLFGQGHQTLIDMGEPIYSGSMVKFND